MRITIPLLRSSSAVPLEEAEHIDLSKKDIMIIERLSICERMRTLILRGNSIKSIHNVDCCRQLWSIDISGNKVKSLCGLSRFPVLGSVCLGGNQLDWKELHRISHITILSLTLVGNPQLDLDPYYRRHVVDMLPNVWMLDGKLITAEEHKQVEMFFSESEASAHPVRRKASDTVFIPTTLKNLLIDGVFGDKTAHMMSKFPINYIHNTEMDKKRLSYLIYSIEDDLKVAHRHLAITSSPSHMQSTATEETNALRTSHQIPDLQSLFEHREKEVEQCNMLLLLMLAGLEYSIPSSVMQTTLETAKLTSIGDVQCMDLFLLPKRTMLDIASLLLSAATVDRLENREGGLYTQLYKSLCFTMETVQRKMYSSRKTTSPAKKLGESNSHSVWRCLLASEVVHLMCLVPQFFESLQTNEGLIKMTVVATKNPNVSDVIADIIWRIQTKRGDVWEVYQEIASYLLQATSENVVGKKKRRPAMQPSVHRTTSQLFQSTQPRLSPRMLRAKSAGAVKRTTSRRVLRSAGANKGLKEPELGDMVMMSPEQVARIVAFPDPRTVVLQITSYPTPLSSNQPDAYFYMDTNGLLWDWQLKCWTKDSLNSDTSYSHLSDSMSFSTIPALESITSLNEYIISRATTPDHGNYHAARPPSGMSFRSDDLQTIPSQEEISDEDQIERPSSNTLSPRSGPLSPIKVDFGTTAQSSTSIASESDHQKHVLQQYSINQLQTSDLVTPKMQSINPTPIHQDITHSPRARALQDLQKATHCKVQENEDFTVPTPHLQLSEIWESEKSVPKVSSSHYSKPHSCRTTELNRQNHMVEPHMCPSPVFSASSQTLSPFRSSPSDDPESPSFMSFTHDRPVLYNAWSVAKPNAPTKHSLLTSSRLMHKRQPKTPPVTRQTNERYSTPGTHASLYTRQQQTQPAQQKQNSHAGKSASRYLYHHPKKSIEGTGVRKLGKTKVAPDLFIGNGRRR